NACLDALAAHRQTQGLPATSLAWGLWQQDGTGMTAHLTHADLARMQRGGAGALGAGEGFSLLDAALKRPESQLVAVKFDLGALQGEAGAGIPPLFRALVLPQLRQAETGAGAGDSGSGLMSRLAALEAGERLAALVEFVRTEAAAAAGLPGLQSVGADKPLKELGLDSLMSVELKNRIARRTGSDMPSTLAFDYPTPKAIAEYLHRRLAFGEAAPEGPPEEPAAAARWALARVDPALLRESGLLAQLVVLAQQGRTAPENGAGQALRAAAELTESEIDKALDAVFGDLAV
ncbi:beta-ketoacyl reductase, partial [Streptomyces sp. NPDC056730]